MRSSATSDGDAVQVMDLIEHLRQAGLEANEVEEFLDAQPALTFSVWSAVLLPFLLLNFCISWPIASSWHL